MRNSFHKQKILSALFYALPVIFLIACYFLMTVTSEDVYQGAATKANYIRNFFNAFNCNARICDMYAWGVIPAFDYTFKFGLDTIFRAIDVLFASGIIYMVSHIVLGEKPSLNLKSASVFMAVFCMVFLSSWGKVFYEAFSHLHNYLLISIFTLLFLIRYANMLRGKNPESKPWVRVTAAIAGFFFGFSSNITPITFLITFAIFFVAKCVLYKEKKNIKSQLLSWQAFSIYGMLLSMGMVYIVGPGISVYMSEEYTKLADYISISGLFTQPAKNFLRLLSHIVENMKVMTPCIVPMTITFGIEVILYRNKNRVGEYGDAMFSAACLVFVLLHTLVMSQILISPLIRLTVPAFLVFVASIGFTSLKIIKMLSFSKNIKVLSCLAMALIIVTMTLDMGIAKHRYAKKIDQLLEVIENGEYDTVWIPYSLNKYEESDIFGFEQYPFLQSWVIADRTVKDKKIMFSYDK